MEDFTGPIDPPHDVRTFGVPAGANNYNLRTCPICNSEGEKLIDPDTLGWSRWFIFKDQLSAREYLISGLCQKCQDDIFTPPVEEDCVDYAEPAF